jgi:hypothetical protein
MTILREFKIHMNYVIEGEGALVNEAWEETPQRPVTLHWLILLKNTNTEIRAINLLR